MVVLDDVPLPHLPRTTRTLTCVPPLVGRNRAGWFMQRVKVKIQTFWPQGGNPLQNLGPRVYRGLTPPRTLTSTGGGAGKWIGAQQERQRAQKNSGFGS